MKKQVNVLIVEDSEDDAKLALRILQRAGFEPTHRRVQAAAELEAALAAERWDAVISDFNMPGFSGMEALRICRATGLDLPFILISGTVGEEIAVDAMKAGANDYIVKVNLSRLAPVFERELHEAENRAAQRRAEQKQHEVRQLLDNIVENIPTSVQLKSVKDDFRIQMWNKAAEEMYGVPRDAAIGRTVHDLWPDTDAARMHASDLELAANKSLLDFPDRLAQTIDRGDIHVHMRKVALCDSAGNATHLLVIADDITARLAAQRKLVESEQRLRTIIEAEPECVKMVSKDMVLLDINPAGLAMMEADSLAEAQAQPLADSIVPEYRVAFADLHARVMRGESGKLEYELIGLKGGRRWLETHAVPLGGKDGEATIMLGVTRDITARKLGEEKLSRFSTAMDATADAIYLVDRASMQFVHVNEAACRMQGRSRDEMFALGPAGVLSTSRAELERTYDAIIASGADAEPVEMLRSRGNGAQAWVELRRHAQRSGDRWTIVTLVRDITNRKKAAQDLRDSEARFRSLSILSSDWFWEQDAQYRFVKFSGGEGKDAWSKDQSGSLGLRRWELPAVTPVGGNWNEHKALVEAHQPFRDLEYQRTLGGGALQYVEASGEPIFDADGRFTGYRGVATDVTERKAAEVRIKRLNRVYAVLSGINTLIVRARDSDALFRESCQIAVQHGRFQAAWIGVVDRSAGKIIPVAAAGVEPEFLTLVKDRFSLREDAPLGNTMTARAIREKKAIVSNDIRGDSRILLAKERIERGIASIAVLPLLVAGEATGVLALHADEPGFFDEKEMTLLTELAGDIAFALEHIEEAQKLARMTRVNAMLSGVNGAIVRIRNRQELFQEACRIAVETGGMAFAWLGVADASGKHLQVLASAGSDDGFLQTIRDRLAVRDDAPEAQGLSVRAIRERRAVVMNDVAADAVLGRRQAFANRGIKSIAVFPLFIADRVIGAFALHSEQTGFFDAGEMKLLNEVAGNIAFALEHIEKEEKVLRLTRVYAVLSGINALIVRVRDRDELFREACRIAVEHGKFAMSWIGALDAATQDVTPVAWAGEAAEELTRAKSSARADTPRGAGAVGQSIRERKPIFNNNILTQSFGGPRLKEIIRLGFQSHITLPLFEDEAIVATLTMYTKEQNFFDDEELRLLTGLASDISFAISSLAKQERLDYLAYYDELTGLANRALFLERVAQYIRGAVSGGHKLAVFFVDLERFRNVNDSLGRPSGDALLKQVSEWLSGAVGDANLLARLGTDHFAVVLPKLTQAGSVAGLLDKRVQAFLDHSFQLNDTEIRIAAKIGVAIFPNDGTDADTLLRNAEAALKKAKARGDRYLFYKPKMNEMAAGKLSLETQLRQALHKEEFVLHYQPKIDLETGKLTGAEALIRWNDPRTGLVPPGRFIPVLEETGLILEVGRWALRQAISEHLRWRAAGLPAPRIAVNVSPLQLRNPGFIAEIGQVLGMDARAAAGLELEITESLIMEDVEHNIASLAAIRAMGVTIAIDDFGTGFSSLSYLAKLPVDTLKIDRSFVIEMTAEAQGLSLVSTIINLAHALKLKVVAEGVETEEQSRLLRLLRCDEMQGFLFSKPVPAEIFEAKFLALAPIVAAA